MKKTIRIFVAGSKVLKTERNALKAVAQDLNTRYHENAVDVSIVMKSYEHFKDRQNEYNTYISEYADLVIFVLDGRIGEFTREEFRKAAEAYKKKEIPEILVFLKDFKEETEGIREIKNLLRDSTGEEFFYINYSNDEDLQSKAKERINRFVTPTEHSRDTKRWRMIAICTAVATLLTISGLVYWALSPKTTIESPQKEWALHEPFVLFMGGGSVYKYIEEKGGVKVDSIDGYKNSIYMPVATGNLWSMIAEEYYRDRLGKEEKFFPIFLAATKIDINEVNKKSPTKGKLSDNILICELNLGNDTTVVYLSEEPKEYKEKTIDRRKVRCLNADQLCDEINKAKTKDILYTTSLKSGTFISFSSVLRERLDSDSISRIFNSGRREFHEQYVLGEPNYMVLGSVFYYPKIGKSLSAGSMYSVRIPHDEKSMYYVLDANEEFYLKDMCIYFVAYHDSTSEDRYVIPKPVLNFLTKNLNMEVHEPQWEKIFKNDGRFSAKEVSEILSDGYTVRFNATLRKRD